MRPRYTDAVKVGGPFYTAKAVKGLSVVFQFFLFVYWIVSMLIQTRHEMFLKVIVTRRTIDVVSNWLYVQ